MDLQTYGRYLVLAAHHDDESLFFGGTLAKLANEGGTQILIVTLTAVANENPPQTPEQQSGDAQRQKRRLAAFWAVCQSLHAESLGLSLPQVNRFSAPEAHAYEESAYRSLLAAFRAFRPDCILTHGREGDYTQPGYSQGWEDAREQHKLAYRLAKRLPNELPDSGQPVVKLAYDLFGTIRVRYDAAAKTRLLDNYRFGCTQAPEWRPEQLYPQFCANEAFVVIE